MSAEVLSCRWTWVGDGEWIEDGGVAIEQGRIARVLRSRRAVARAASAARKHRDLGEGALVPGLVDAHAHLELSALAGRIAPATPFGEWVRAVIGLRAALSRSELEAGVLDGARRLLESGTTTVGDIDTTGSSLRALARSPIRHVLYREVLDAHDPARTDAALARIARALPARARRREGLSPHAPFTVGPRLLHAAAAIARRRRAPVAIHWSETEAEVEWLLRGRGPLARMLGRSPMESGLDGIERAGLLGRSLALIHGNHPRAREPSRIARAGATVVHCPGCHLWFGRERFDLDGYVRAGTRVALGTDSLASNDALDMMREMSLLRASHPSRDPLSVWRMATVHAADALAAGGEIGAIAPRAHADLAWRELDGRSPRDFLERLTTDRAPVREVWIAGKSLSPRRSAALEASSRAHPR